jgi:Tol biopolymer transport system component
MKPARFLPLLCGLGVIAGAAAIHTVSVAAQAAGPTYKESDFLTRIRRLTVEGLRAGEGYWSPDGARLVFQSERDPSNPFYQIYTLDLRTGETKRISPGIGKTTCAFFRPGTDEIEFASTHADPQSRELQKAELDFRASGQTRRYSWDYDTHMDIWSYNEKTGQMKQLHHEGGRLRPEAADQRPRLRRRPLLHP